MNYGYIALFTFVPKTNWAPLHFLHPIRKTARQRSKRENVIKGNKKKQGEIDKKDCDSKSKHCVMERDSADAKTG